MHNLITLEVITPERQIISIGVDELQFPTLDNGYYGILLGHTPLIVPVGDGLVTFTYNACKHWVTIFGGFAEVMSDHVTIFARISETVEMIDVERAEIAKLRAIKDIQEATVETDLDLAMVKLKMSLIRLQAAGRVNDTEV